MVIFYAEKAYEAKLT